MTNDRPQRVSVVMCTYNGAAHIEEQLRSILDQSLTPVEVIVSDDGSTDGTLDVVDAIARETSVPVRARVNDSRLGFAGNFLSACELATGEFVAFSDQDDRWARDKIEKQLAAMLRVGAAVAVHDVQPMDQAGNDLSIGPAARARSELVSWRNAPPWGNYLGFTMLFERRLLQTIPAAERGLDPHSHGRDLSHDRWIYFLAITLSRIVVLPDRLARYRQHDQQLYGGLVPRTVRQRLRTKLSGGLAQATYLADLADFRSHLISSRLPPSESRTRGEQIWSAVSRHYGRVADLHRSKRFGAVGAFIRSAGTGVYLPYRFGGLGRPQLLQDGAVVLAKLLGLSADRPDAQSGATPEEA